MEHPPFSIFASLELPLLDTFYGKDNEGCWIVQRPSFFVYSQPSK